MSSGKINVVYPKRSRVVFHDMAVAFQDIFRKLNFETHICHSIDATDTDIEVILGFINFKTKTGKFDNKRYVIVQTEQLPMETVATKWQKKKWDKLSALISANDIIWDFYYPYHKHLYNNTATYVKFGYHESFDNNMNIDKKYDFCFYGSKSLRRKNVIDKLIKKHCCNDQNCKLFGVERISAINSSKICLNIHYSEANLIEFIRVISHYLCNNSFVISEPFIGHNWLADKGLLVVSELNDFEKVVEYYLKNEKERKDIASFSYNEIKKHTLFESVKENLLKI